MAVDPSVKIDIAAEFTGKKAFKQADTATDKLTKGVKKLGGALGLAFGAAAVVNFSKQAVKSFAEDEAAAIRLTRAVENLGIGFANPAISKFISDLERSAGVADDVLRPSFQGLLTTTGSLVQSQKLLNDAITISRASGIDLATVSNDLAKGYVGITKGLAKYNTGLTKSELSTKSFSEILGILLTRSAGAATDYLGTTSYQMDVLGIATSNASEIIGGGLIDAFAAVGGGSEASDAAYVIETIATAIAKVTRAAGGAIGVIPNLIKNLKNLPKSIFGGFVSAQAGVKVYSTPTPSTTTTSLQLSEEKRAKLLAKLEADSAKRAKAIAALQAKSLAAANKSAAINKANAIKDAALKKAAANFDLNKIQIAAALKATYDKDTRLRLLAMQAIENENGEAALAYLKQLDILNKEILTNKLAGIKTISETELNYLNQMLLDELEAIRISGMSEADKAAARQAAYNKYNAAIVESGGLADKNFYSASTQADLLTIARLAGVDTVAAAQKTIDLFNYNEQIKIIDAVSAAQKIADDDKMKRLLEYLALLAQPIRLGGVLPFEDLPSTLGTGGAPVITGNTGTGVVEVIPQTNVPVTGTSSMFNPYGVTPGSSAGAGTQGNFDYGTVNITVEGSILNGDDFVSIVNEAILNGNKIGLSNLPAGFLPG